MKPFFFCFGVQNLCLYKSQTIIPRPINSEIENWKPDQIYFFSSFTVFLFNITDTNFTVNSNKKTAQKKKKKILIKKKTEKELKRIVVQKKRTKENHLLFRLLSTTAIVMGTSTRAISSVGRNIQWPPQINCHVILALSMVPNGTASVVDFDNFDCYLSEFHNFTLLQLYCIPNSSSPP